MPSRLPKHLYNQRLPLCSLTSAVVLLLAPTTSYNAPHQLAGCEFEVLGTTQPNTSGTPAIISETTGTVISANFFNSGAISPIDGLEFVSVCVSEPDVNGIKTAEISSDVGQADNAQIKGYPQFVVGTKFGNQFETSFRFYSNNGLPQDQRWPVTATNLNDADNPFQFSNLEYISNIREVGLPAFTNNLPEITVTLDIDEINIVGAERDVMLESWFYDTSANADKIGSDTTSGSPIVSTLNNIVGAGHQHYPELNNTLLEMMVHIGALSPNDVSGATRNPGQNQLTETFSGKDTDGDGIDDHFDVDSHINVNNNQDPQPGMYSSGIDNNADGIDDADILPITIGSHKYSIWYGETFLSPLVIFSRETNASQQSNFDPLNPDMNLSDEGEIQLPWNDFLDYTLNTLEPALQLQYQTEIAAGGTRTLEWIEPDASGSNLFTKMRSAHGAIGGIEFGIEPQTNGNGDLPYSTIINKFDVYVDGTNFGLTDTHLPNAKVTSPINNSNISPAIMNVSGIASDPDSGIDRVLVNVQQLGVTPAQFWNGSAWTPASVFPEASLHASNTAWTLPNVDLTNSGNYRVSVIAIDNAGNGEFTGSDLALQAVNSYFSVDADTTPPSITIDTPASNSTLPVAPTISGTASDLGGSGFDRVRIAIKDRNSNLWYNAANGNFGPWAGQNATLSNTTNAQTNWSLVTSLPAGDYTVIVSAVDNAGNFQANASGTTLWTSRQFFVEDEPVTNDITNPTVTLDPIGSPTQGLVIISGTSEDNIAIDRTRLYLQNTDTGQHWNGSAWVNGFAWFLVNNTSPWDYDILLAAGSYRTIAFTWDTSENRTNTLPMAFPVQ